MPINERINYGCFSVAQEWKALFGLIGSKSKDETVIVNNGNSKLVNIGWGLDKGVLDISQYEDGGSRVQLIPNYFSSALIGATQDHLSEIFRFETASNINFPVKTPVELEIPHILGSTKVKVTRIK